MDESKQIELNFKGKIILIAMVTVLTGIIQLFCKNNYLHASSRDLYTECLNKKGTTGTNMLISLKLDKHLNNFGYYLRAISSFQRSDGTKKCRFCHVS